jgi:hypothetical protein
MRRNHVFFYIGWLVFFSSCTSSKKISSTQSIPVSGVKFINEYVFPSAVIFKGTTIGGLSSIDYDVKRDLYYLICDDRSDKNPARYYSARIFIGEKGIDSIRFTDVVTLLDKNGKPYPSHDVFPSQSPDPESMRYNPVTDELIWSSEGERLLTKDKTALKDPGIYIIDRGGHFKDSFALPRNMHIRTDEKGPRRNGVLEGTAFSPDYKHLFASVEEPLYEDGPRAGSGDSTAWVRFIKFNTKIRHPVAEYAYQIDAVTHPANPPGAFKVNGISEILNIGEEQFIVMERSFSTGRNSNTVKLYLADAHYADDITGIASLNPMPAVRPISKKLLLNMDDLGRYIDNVEGITFGPLLPNGHRSLVLVVDDNFDSREKIQFFLLEIEP